MASDEWAEGFCTAISTWGDSLQAATSDLSDASSLSSESLQQTADDVQAATEQLGDDLRALGRPDTESGEEIESSIDQLTTTLETEAAEVEDTVQGISGVTDLPAAISSLTASLSAMSTAFSTTMASLEDADVQNELEDAFESSPACDELTN